MEFLASDSMKGRATGTPEALECARWIAKKFESYGLQPYDTVSGYLQPFTLARSKNLTRNLILNNTIVSPEDFIVVSQARSLRFNDPHGITVVTIGERDDFMAKFDEINGLDDSYIVLINPFHKRRFERLKNYLSSSRYTLKTDDHKFSLWVLSTEDHIDKIDLQANNKVEELQGNNVAGVLPGGNDTSDIWIISAHYDHLGYLNPVNGDSVANGANDDASGVTAVLELARIFSEQKTGEKTLWFVAFDAEELGLLGSQAFARSLNTGNIEGVINIEMIGTPNADLGDASAYISGYDYSPWPALMSESVPPEEFMFFPDPYPELQLFVRSDNYSFATYGIPAHTISTYSSNDTTYHQVNDDLNNIDFENMKLIIDNIYRGSLPLLKKDFDPGKPDFINKQH